MKACVSHDELCMICIALRGYGIGLTCFLSSRVVSLDVKLPGFVSRIMMLNMSMPADARCRKLSPKQPVCLWQADRILCMCNLTCWLCCMIWVLLGKVAD